jgi:hypothetical protein
MFMTSQPSTVESADTPAPPADPAAYRRSRGVGYRALVLACLVSVVAGVLISRFIPQRLAAPDEIAASVAAFTGQAAPAPADPPPPMIAPIVAPAAPEIASSAELSGVTARLDRLEVGQARTAGAATAALAAATLAQATQTSRPFGGELALVESLMPTAGAAGLRQIAQRGAPTRAGLARAFPAAAAQATRALGSDPSDQSLSARATRALASIVSIRRVDSIEGDGPDALLARAEERLIEGDVEGALEALDRLPRPARDAMASWRVDAERRVEVDRRVSAIRTAALQTLEQQARGLP